MTIKLVKQSDMVSALSASIPYRAGPDIVAFSNDPIGEWASAGYLVPLDEWVDHDYLSANFEPAAVKGMIWKDQIWGIPDMQ